MARIYILIHPRSVHEICFHSLLSSPEAIVAGSSMSHCPCAFEK